MRRAAVYVRISRDPSGEGLGVGRQEEDARALAEKRGWEVVATFTDNDASATSGRARPGWEALLEAIGDGKVNALVAYSSSRLYRRPADLGRLIQLVKAKPGFQIATVASGPIVLDTADGRMLAGILAEVDQAEADRIRERVSRARKARVQSGLDAGGSRPFGYEALPTGPPRKRDGKPRLQITGEVVPEEAAAIRDAAQRLPQGESIRSILRDWEKRGIRTSKGYAWTSASLRHTLRSPRLAGVHPETGERAHWKPILTQRVHRDLVALYADPARLRARRGDRYLLTGLVFCGVCGTKLRGRPSGRARRYVCNSLAVHLSIAADPLEVYVVDTAEPHAPADLTQVFDPAAVSAPILAQLDEIDAKIASWAVEAAEAGLRAADIRAGTVRLTRRRAVLEAELEAVRPEPEGLWAGLDTVLQNTRIWLEATVDRVTVQPLGRGRGRAFNPERVEITYLAGRLSI
jgi:site-specific DNA recombinase